MEEEPVDRLQHFSDAVRMLVFVFSCLSRVSNYFGLMSFSLLGLELMEELYVGKYGVTKKCFRSKNA